MNCSFCGTNRKDAVRMFEVSTASICADCVLSCALKLTQDERDGADVRLVSLRAELEDMRNMASEALEFLSHAQARLKEMGGEP